jgi:peptidoglycan/LPS O-acetylase OafA/YrhL
MGALVVMAYHFYCFKVFPGAFFTKGYLAVDLFFVLSGVVLAEAYTARLSQGLTTSNFLKIRFIRLYPYYFISLVGSLAMTLIYLCFFKINSVHWTPGGFIGSLIFAVFMLPSPFMARLFPFVDQAWSLFYELLVNFFWVGTRSWLKSAGLGMTAIFAAAGLIYLGHSTSLDGGGSWLQIDMGIFRVLYSFSVGLLIHDMDKSRIPKLNPWVILLAAFCVMGAIPPPSLSPLFDLAAVLLVLPCCVLFATVVEPPQGMQSGFLDFIGDSSYGIYMIHFEVAMLIHWVLNKFGFSPSFLIAAVAMFAVVMAAHWLNSVWDKPARAWLSRIGSRG